MYLSVSKIQRLLFLFTLISTTASAQNTVQGYIRTAANDSVPVMINLQKKSLLKTIDVENRLVVFLDSTGTVENERKPDDIKGYGYVDKGSRYDYFSKPIDEKHRLFLKPYATGSRASLYMYSESRTMSSGISTVSTYTENYTLEKGSAQTGYSYLYLNNWDGKNDIIHALLRFYQDVPNLQQILEGKFEKKKNKLSDLIQVVQAINAGA